MFFQMKPSLVVLARTLQYQLEVLFNPFVPGVRKIKIRNLIFNRILIVEFVKKMVYLDAHYSERQGLMG